MPRGTFESTLELIQDSIDFRHVVSLLVPIARTLPNVVSTIRVSEWDKEPVTFWYHIIPSAHADGTDRFAKILPGQLVLPIKHFN
jgi:hypothetical protein